MSGRACIQPVLHQLQGLPVEYRVRSRYQCWPSWPWGVKDSCIFRNHQLPYVASRVLHPTEITNWLWRCPAVLYQSQGLFDSGTLFQILSGLLWDFLKDAQQRCFAKPVVENNDCFQHRNSLCPRAVMFAPPHPWEQHHNLEAILINWMINWIF